MLLLFACSLVACDALAGCGSSTSQPTPNPTAPAVTVTVPFDLPVIVSLAGYFDDQTLSLLDAQIEVFEAANPDVMVEIVAAPREANARREAFADLLGKGDTTRDIYLLNPGWLAQFAANDWLAPVDEYAGSAGLDFDSFFPASVEANTIAGKTIALPWTMDGGILYFRQDLFDKYGFKPPETWVDVQHIALDLKLEEKLPSGYVWQGAAYEGLTCNTLEFIWASGGATLDDAGNVVFDSARTRQALQEMLELIASGASPAAVTTYREAASLNVFQNDGAALMRNWSYAWDRVNAQGSALAGKVGIAALPASCLGGSSLALSAYSQHPEQAFRFIAFLTGYEQQAQLAFQGVQPPALETVYSDHDWLAADPSLQHLHAALSASQPRPQTAVYPELSEVIYSEVNRMLDGKQDVETTAANIQLRLQAVIERP
jgi:multiple sugar transport system substrate-binding protein